MYCRDMCDNILEAVERLAGGLEGGFRRGGGLF